MASLFEYFVKDGVQNLTTQKSWTLGDPLGTKHGEVVAKLHLDFDANAKFLSFYIPVMPSVECPEALLLNKIDEVLNWPDTKLAVHAGFVGEKPKDANTLVFTGQIYLYSERPVRADLRQRLEMEAAAVRHVLTFRSVDYMTERNKLEKPLAFISHDSRDDVDIAQPLALQLQKMMCPVWYDQFSLRVGDSLRESIEKGLKECPKCVLVLTPNFLQNGGWSKREYDSVFTREIVEQNKVILPVWHNVTVKDVYEYSPVLADRVAVQWTDGVEQVARKLFQSINAPV